MYLRSDETGEVTLDDVRTITGTSKGQISPRSLARSLSGGVSEWRDADGTGACGRSSIIANTAIYMYRG
jgi:hypothetical protein